MISKEGLYGIKATILAHSICNGISFVTFEIEYPRLILAEFNTHRSLSRNSASSRAIPFLKMMEQLTARPVRFGQANKGMQDKGSDFDEDVEIPGLSKIGWATIGHDTVYDAENTSKPFDLKVYAYHENVPYIATDEGYVTELLERESVHVPPEDAWEEAKQSAVGYARAYAAAGYHKQVYNRLVEPFQMMKTVVSGTEFNNFFWLRDDDAADPTIHELARVMREALALSEPMHLSPGQWHLPYVDREIEDDGTLSYSIVVGGDGLYGRQYLTVEDAIIVSAARSAAVSFRNVDYGLEKCKEVHARLVGDARKHASALEHQATPMQHQQSHWEIEKCVNVPQFPGTWEPGVSHMDRKMQLWSGNLCGWVQYRKLIPGENMEG